MSSLALPSGSRDALAEIVTGRPELLIMTDYDGTLVPIRDRPELAVPGPELLQVVKRLREINREPNRELNKESNRETNMGLNKVAFAVISGRRLEDLEKMIPVSGIYLVGCHGAQFRTPSGERFAKADPEKLRPVIDRLAQIASWCTGGKKGFLIENKGISLALHYRLAEAAGRAEAVGPAEGGGRVETAVQLKTGDQSIIGDQAETREQGETAVQADTGRQVETGPIPEVVEVLESFLKKAAPFMAGAGLEAITGKKVVEIRPRYINKGETVKYLMDLYPKHYPVYFGDDTTDEDAFTAVAERGTGVLVSRKPVLEKPDLKPVCRRPGYYTVMSGQVGPGRCSAASLRVPEPADVIRFLQNLAAGS